MKPREPLVRQMEVCWREAGGQQGHITQGAEAKLRRQESIDVLWRATKRF